MGPTRATNSPRPAPSRGVPYCSNLIASRTPVPRPHYIVLLRKGHSPRFIAKGGLIALFPPPSAELIWVTMGKGRDCHGKAGRHQRGGQTTRSLVLAR